jgi:hypothetical protein
MCLKLRDGKRVLKASKTRQRGGPSEPTNQVIMELQREVVGYREEEAKLSEQISSLKAQIHSAKVCVSTFFLYPAHLMFFLPEKGWLAGSVF